MIEQTTPATGATATEPNEIQDEILRSLTLRHEPGDRICVASWQRNGDGEFHFVPEFVDGIDAALQAILGLKPDVGAVWTNLQKLQAGATARTEAEITAYANFAIDIDRRDKGRPLLDAEGKPILDAKGKARLEHINATDAERQALAKGRDEISAFLLPYFRRGIVADSGNGYHLEWPTVPLDPKEGRELYQGVLRVLAHKFERPDMNMSIDMRMDDPARVLTVWGTWNRKYPDEKDRPHRQTKKLSWPRTPHPLSANDLDRVALENPVPASTRAKNSKKGDMPEVDPRWLEEQGPEHLCEWGKPFTQLMGTGEKGGKQYWWLGNCFTTWRAEDGYWQHKDGKEEQHTALTLGDTFGYECFSDDCADCTIKDFMRRLEELKGKKYPHRIFLDDGPELAAEVFGAESPDEEPEQVKPNGKSHDESYNRKGTLCPKCNKELIGGAQDQECQSCMAKAGAADLPPGEEHVLVGAVDGEKVYVSVTHMDKVDGEPYEWMWDQRLLKWALNFFAGKPERCKTLGALKVAAVITTGEDFPDGRRNTLGPRTVLLLMSEDSVTKAIWGRLVAAGADLSRVKAINGVIIGEDMRKRKKKRLLALKHDLTALRSLIRQYPDTALVIIDPISSYYGCNANKADEVKPVLDSIAALCEETQTTFLLTAHTTKRSDVDALQSMGGATEAGATYRSGWTFDTDPDDESQFVMTSTKGNYAKDKSGLKFKVEGQVVKFKDGRECEYPKINWLGSTSMKSQDVLETKKDKQQQRKDGKFERACKWLKERLSRGEQIPSNTIFEEGATVGHSRKTLYNAKDELGIKAKKKKDEWVWELPITDYKPDPLVPDPQDGL